MPTKDKWILYVDGEAQEVFEGTKEQAEARATEIWQENAEPDIGVDPYTKQQAVEDGLEDEEDE